MQPSSLLKSVLFAATLAAVTSLPLPAQSPAPAASPSPPGPPFGRPDHAPPFHPPPNPLLEALDTNHDGILSADEIANAPASLKKLDKNGDGQLTEDELRPPPPPGGRGGPPRGPGNQPANRPGSAGQPDPPPMPPGSPPGGGRDPSAGNPAQPALAGARVQRPAPPRLEDDPVAARLDKAAQGAAGQTPRPQDARVTLFDLLDTNHDGVLSEEELRDAPAVLRRLDLKSIGPIDHANVRPPSPTPVN